MKPEYKSQLENAIKELQRLEVEEIRNQNNHVKRTVIELHKVIIWNRIRSFCIDAKFTTLWQAAIAAGYPMVQCGEERKLPITSQQIAALIPESEGVNV